MPRPPKVRDDELIEAVDYENRDGFLITTPEVADKLDVDRRTASNRLKSLEEEGKVVSEPHGRSTGWRLPAEIVVKDTPTGVLGGGNGPDTRPLDETTEREEDKTSDTQAAGLFSRGDLPGIVLMLGVFFAVAAAVLALAKRKLEDVAGGNLISDGSIDVESAIAGAFMLSAYFLILAAVAFAFGAPAVGALAAGGATALILGGLGALFIMQLAGIVAVYAGVTVYRGARRAWGVASA